MNRLAPQPVWLTFVLICAALLALGTGCRRSRENAAAEARQRVGGDPERGAVLLRRYGCGGCHRIPGIPGAAGKSAPALENLREQSYVLGTLPNTPENLIHWICAPHSIRPKTRMPDLGVSPAEARDMTTYLWSLR